MDKEITDEALQSKAEAHGAVSPSEPTETEPLAATEPRNNNSLAQKRGRLIVAGVLTAVLLSVVAVVVAGIFGLTSRWMKVCPTDLPVNDPARQLSQLLEGSKTEPQPLGVSGTLAQETRLKDVAAPQNRDNGNTNKGK